MSRRSQIVVGAAAVVVVMAVLPPMRTAAVVAFVLVVPGWLLATAIVGRHIAVAEGIVLALALSISVVIVGGLALHWIGAELSALTWSVLLGAVIAGALAVVAYRRPPGSNPILVVTPRFRELGLVLAGLLVMSLAINYSAVVASASRTADDPTLAELWVLGAEERGLVTVGARNLAGVENRYRLEVVDAAGILARRHITLGPYARWSEDFQLDAGTERIDVLLYRPGDADPFRHVWTAVGN